MGDWLREEQTSRIYYVEIENLKLQYPVWTVTNEYKTVRCPDCNGIQYLRLTHIHYQDSKGNVDTDSDCHINTDSSKIRFYRQV